VTSAGTPVTMTYLNPDENQRIRAGGTYYGTGVLGVSYQTTNESAVTSDAGATPPMNNRRGGVHPNPTQAPTSDVVGLGPWCRTS